MMNSQCRDPHVGRTKGGNAMTQLSGFSSLAAIPEEKITDKITRRVLAGQKGMMVWWKIGAGTHVATHSHPRAARVDRQGQGRIPHR
jgi:hypothetical protein